MTFAELSQTLHQTSDLVVKGDFEAGLALLRPLIDSDLPDLDKVIVAVNIAIVCDKMAQTADALNWYDFAISLEQPLMRFFAMQRKATYLDSVGRKPEALAICESLVQEPFLQVSEIESLREYMATLKA